MKQKEERIKFLAYLLRKIVRFEIRPINNAENQLDIRLLDKELEEQFN